MSSVVCPITRKKHVGRLSYCARWRHHGESVAMGKLSSPDGCSSGALLLSHAGMVYLPARDVMSQKQLFPFPFV